MEVLACVLGTLSLLVFTSGLEVSTASLLDKSCGGQLSFLRPGTSSGRARIQHNNSLS